MILLPSGFPRSEFMRRSRNFHQGCPGPSDKKSSDNVFFFFLVLSLFYRSQMVNFKEIYHFSRFQRGSNIFQGGVQLFPEGSNRLFPIEIHITCDFPGGVQTPCPPSGSDLGICCSQHFSQWKLLEPNEINFSQGFS